jgi:iron(III) transport system permease protein
MKTPACLSSWSESGNLPMKRLREVGLDLRRLAAEPALLATILALFAALALFVAYPVWRILTVCFSNPGGHFTFANLTGGISKSYNYVPFLHSVTLGVMVAVAGTIVGYIFAFCLTRVRIPAPGFIRTVATFPIILPPFVVAMAAILLLGRNGWVTNALLNHGIDTYKTGFDIYGLFGMAIVETLSYFPTAFLVMLGVLGAINTTLEEAAMDLGASRMRVFLSVTLPMSLPGVAASMLLLFIESLADFGTPMILSGHYTLLPTQAYLLITGARHDLSGGSLLAIMLLFPSLIAFIVQKYLLERKSLIPATGKPGSGAIKELPPAARYSLFAFCMTFVAAILIFFGMVLFGSFTKQWGADHALTFSNYAGLFAKGSDNLRAISVSLGLAALATPVCGVLGILIAFLVTRAKFPGRGTMEFISMLTFALPGTVVGIGYVLAFKGKPFMLVGTMFLMIVQFVFRNMPVGIRAGVASLSQIDKAIEEASLDMGASRIQTFTRVTLPLIAPAFFTGLAYSFVKSMTAISAVIFLVTGNLPLITISILNAVERSEYSQAAAFSVVLIVIILAALGLINLLVKFMSSRGLANAPGAKPAHAVSG